MAITQSADEASIAIKVRVVSKCYQIYEQPEDRLKQAFLPRMQRLLGREEKCYYREFWALRDVSFEVRKGETLGVIGRNGSGKSTLLQIICGTLTPTSGSVEVNGRVAALLELGSGFNPEFTGRENVYMSGMVLGLTKQEIDERFTDIATFAGIGAFIEQPVKTFSSGMFVRLAFAVIAHADASILVIDEALAVGDVFFTQKCMRFIRQFQDNGGTILFVSHDMTAVTSICTSAVMLFPGGERKAISASAETLCKNYLNQIYDDPARRHQVENQRVGSEDSIQTRLPSGATVLSGGAIEANAYAISDFRKEAESFGEGRAVIVDAGFYDENRKKLSTITGGQSVSFIISVQVKQRIVYPALGLMIKDRLGQYIYTEGTDQSFRHHEIVFEPNDRVDAIFRFTMPILICGQYTLNVAIAEGLGHDHIQHHWIHDAIQIESISSPVAHGICGLPNVEMSLERISCPSEGAP